MNNYSLDHYLDHRRSVPKVEVTETETGYHFELKIPGYIKEDFNFYINNDDLVVTTERSKLKKAYNQVQNKNGIHSYCYPSAYFKKRFPMPKNIVKDKIFVDYKNGILSFDLFKKMVLQTKE